MDWRSRALVITLYHQCQSTVGRIVTFLNDLGLGISSRQVRRYLNEATRMVVEEAGEVLKAGLRQAQWINVNDTGARHQAHNGYCTVIGNDRFTHFRSTGSKGRLNFLAHLCAGEAVYTVNAAAVSYWHGRRLPKEVITWLVEGGWRTVDGTEAWHRHLHTRGLGDKKGAIDRVKVATEGALWGTLCARRGVTGPGDRQRRGRAVQRGGARPVLGTRRTTDSQAVGGGRGQAGSGGRGHRPGVGLLSCPVGLPQGP